MANNGVVCRLQDDASEHQRYSRDSNIAEDSMPAYYGSRAFEMSLDLPEPDGRKIRHVRMVISLWLEFKK
ncbi:hypothetical protein M0657_004171 [Pyricularia oryzae]|nr:hypothetical protein M0657_004171 [Pyricularia oryzae]KAI7925610.1 hypothetical protein M9X92_003171 [Pyricularia oryzae]